MTADELVRRLRHLRIKLETSGPFARLAVPVVEVAESFVAEGPRDVVSRAWWRIRGPVRPPRRRYAIPRALTTARARLTIPPADAPVVTSIVIAVSGEAPLNAACLPSIVAYTTAGTYEVIVVHRTAGDSPTIEARVSGLRATLVDHSVGVSDANNHGAAMANGTNLVFLDGQTVVLSGWLEALHRSLERSPAIGAIAAKVVSPAGRVDHAGGIAWSDGALEPYGQNQDADSPAVNYRREVDYGSSTCLLVRRSLFEQLSGFDRQYAARAYADADLCFRIREQGHRVAYEPSACAIHAGDSSHPADQSSDEHRRSRSRFVERHRAALASQFARDSRRVAWARERKTGRRILVMDKVVPRPDHDAGSVRLIALLRTMVDLGHRVTFLPDDRTFDRQYTTELQHLGIEVLYGREFGVEFFTRASPEFEIAILSRARFAPKYLAALEGAARRPFVIFDTVDLHYLREQRFAALEDDDGLKKSAARTQDVELSVMLAADMVWVTSDEEARLLRTDDRLPPIEIVPTIHDLRWETPPFGERRDILFIGGFRHEPNEDAVRFFVSDILPDVRRAVPDVRLMIVGSNLPRRIRRLASESVRILGHIADVRPVFDACRVSVAPLRYGAGIKGKVTQSMAWGVPVIATPIAAEGMQLTDGEQVMIASTPSDFARKLIEVYQSEDLWNRLSDAGRRHIDAHMSERSVGATVERIITHAVSAKPHVGDGQQSLRPQAVRIRQAVQPEHPPR